MPLDHYVSLGRSGLRVSPFCLGTMTFGKEWGIGTDEKTSAEILAHYIEEGGNFIDTANVYNKGHSEIIIGNYFQKRPGKRDQIVLATKFGGNTHPGDPNNGGSGRKAIISACESSLKNLKTDYIDLYWQHWEDPFTPLDETLRALDDLVRDGKIRYVGFSDTSAWKVATAHITAELKRWTPLAAIQVEYSLLERTSEGELIPMAESFGLGVCPWGPLCAGILSGKYSRTNMNAESVGRKGSFLRHANETTYHILDTLSDLAQQYDSTPARVALAWIRTRPGITAPTIGARTLTQLSENLAALEIDLQPSDIEKLTAISTPQLNFPARILPGAYAVSYPDMTINCKRFGDSPMVNEK